MQLNLFTVKFSFIRVANLFKIQDFTRIILQTFKEKLNLKKCQKVNCKLYKNVYIFVKYD